MLKSKFVPNQMTRSMEIQPVAVTSTLSRLDLSTFNQMIGWPLIIQSSSAKTSSGQHTADVSCGY